MFSRDARCVPIFRDDITPNIVFYRPAKSAFTVDFILPKEKNHIPFNFLSVVQIILYPLSDIHTPRSSSETQTSNPIYTIASSRCTRVILSIDS